ncbi:MAG: hypothetical protein ACRD3J_13255, partial [Thermoanaerobaculia bacterium]
MPQIDFTCPDHGPFVQYRSVHSQDLPLCPVEGCTQPTERHWITKAPPSLPDAVVVYQAPDGSYRFPGDPNGLSAAQYSRQGFTRIEARGWAAVRQLERDVEQHENRHRAQHFEHQQHRREQGQHARRSELFYRMKSMSRLGREVGRLSIERSNG